MSKREKVEVSTDIVLQNQIIINEINKDSQEFFEEHGRQKAVYLVTYGCQMNEHDSETLLGMLDGMGYTQVETKEEADLVIYNTCCVRENAELKVFGNLGHLKTLKQNNPNLKIAVCGCMMQQAHIVEEIKKKYSHVDLVFGTHNIHNFPTLLSQTNGLKKTLVEIWNNESRIIEGLPTIRKFGTKSFVNIMYGCNNFCTYCIVPYTRGRERSREVSSIVDEVKNLVAGGVKEITLLGQNVNSYGKTLENPVTFAELLRIISDIDGVKRIRFMTSHPKDISDDLITVMAERENICNHLHLPIQTGSNTLLKAMNRVYDREFYLDFMRKAKAAIPDLAISTDLIIGFPGETEQDILDTIDLIKQVEYDTAYTFIYSMRKGTPAYEMENQIPEDIKKERFNRVLHELNEIVKNKNKKMKDKEVLVLVESLSKNDKTTVTGRTPQFGTVNLPGGEDLIGKIVKVKITNPRNFSLNGELVEVLD